MISTRASLVMREFSLLKGTAVVVLSSLTMGLIAPLAIPLSTPIPLAMGPQMALFLGAFLGSRRGSLAVMGYLFQGAVLALPVFALGKSGMHMLVGPTGGYLVGYVVGAYLTGRIIEGGAFSLGRTCLAFIAGSLAIFTLGASYLSTMIGVKSALLAGVLPFILGDFLKNLIAVKVFSRLQKGKAKLS